MTASRWIGGRLVRKLPRAAVGRRRASTESKRAPLSAVLTFGMTTPLATGRLLLAFVAATYLLSALLLGIARWRGNAVAGWVIGGWAVLGMIGLLLALQLQPARPALWWTLALVLLPWMLLSLVWDWQLDVLVMVAVDAAGAFAIIYGLWLAREAL